MRLKYVEIEHYKHLDNFKLNFRPLDEKINPAAYRFFIGKNGSGKSAAIEAISLIFTRILQDETPGFRFKVVYMIEADGHMTEVTVCNNEDLDNEYCNPLSLGQVNEHLKDIDCQSKLMVTIRTQEHGEQRLSLRDKPFSQRRQYHPKRIIAQASGPTTILEDVLIQSAEMSLKSDLYDVREGAKTDRDYNERANEISLLEGKLKLIRDESPFLFIDSENAIFVMIALCACSPFSDSIEKYCDLRGKLFGVVGNIKPISFSLVIDETALDELKKQAENLTSPERFFLSLMDTEADYADLIIRRKSSIQKWEELEEGNEKHEIVALFYIETMASDQGFSYHVPSLDKTYDPIILLATLLHAHREGFLLSAHLAFQLNEEEDLLTNGSFSDGEYMWLARLGLALLSRYEHDSLFLFDEPDVYLNENWNIDFVRLLFEFTYDRDNNSQEFIIATHSTLVLTDVEPNQLYHFVLDAEGHPKIKPNTISPFGASRDEISMRIFGTPGYSGEFSKNRLSKLLEEADTIEELRELEKKVGPGRLQFSIRDRIYEIEGD